MSIVRPLPIPPGEFTESVAVLRMAAEAHRALAELKGMVMAIPNAGILIETLALKESKVSSEIENIVTTEDDLYRSDLQDERFTTPAAQEVHRYSQGLQLGVQRLSEQGYIRLKDVEDIQAVLVEHRAGLRALPGTVLKNQLTGEVVFEPPQDAREIRDLMSNLLEHFHQGATGTGRAEHHDVLVRMAVLHYQFETIHPFYDGNGRTGRILNLLFLVHHGLLDLPILYLSRFIVRNKPDYYRLLQAVREEGAWTSWVMYMLSAVKQTATDTLRTVRSIMDLRSSTENTIRDKAPKIFSHDLLLNIFRHPYTKVEFVERELGVSRPTATKYLNVLVDLNLLIVRKVGRNNYYINTKLLEILTD